MRTFCRVRRAVTAIERTYNPTMSDDLTDDTDDAGDVDLDEPGEDGSVEPADDDGFDVDPPDDERDGDIG